IVLADRHDTSCLGIISETNEPPLRGLGYAVSRNKPYAGGFITEHYGNPAAGVHSIQLEINRALYMDERRYERSSTFARLAGDLIVMADELAALPIDELRPHPAPPEGTPPGAPRAGPHSTICPPPIHPTPPKKD